jgi:hypothetical protein
VGSGRLEDMAENIRYTTSYFQPLVIFIETGGSMKAKVLGFFYEKKDLEWYVEFIVDSTTSICLQYVKYRPDVDTIKEFYFWVNRDPVSMVDVDKAYTPLEKRRKLKVKENKDKSWSVYLHKVEIVRVLLLDSYDELEVLVPVEEWGQV